MKRYESEKVLAEEGNWRQIKVTLGPTNPAFSSIELTWEDEGQVQMIAEYLEVLPGEPEAA